MTDRFPASLAFTWRPENDGQPFHDDDPLDPGGATAWGVTIGAYAAWRADHGQRVTTNDDLRRATQPQLSELIRARYWAPVRADDLPPGVDLLTYDFGYGSGPGTSARKLQEVAGVRVDGQLGNVTLAAVASAYVRDKGAFLHRLAQAHLVYYQGIGGASGWSRYGKGWGRRNASRLVLACQMAGVTGVVPPLVVRALPPPDDDAATEALNDQALARAQSG